MKSKIRIRNLAWMLLVGVMLSGCETGGDVVGVDLGNGAGDVDWSGQETTPRLPDIAPDVDLHGLPTDTSVEVSPDGGGCETGGGCFGDPCDDGSDCLSGLCVDHMGDSICSQTCVEECPGGFLCKEVSMGGPDTGWICVSGFPRLCRPCTTDDDCLSSTGLESRCIDYPEEGRFCGGTCAVDEDCPLGFGCGEAKTLEGVSISQCLHDAGVCPCVDKAVQLALSTPCYSQNDFGLCSGIRYCGETGLTACDAGTPAAEDCNGIDDDCDGEIDEETCEDDNACTTDGCDPEMGCIHQNVTGDDCDDGDDCTLGDFCDDGLCAGEPVTCNDGNPCTTDACDPDTGCKFTPYNGPCDDGDPCTYGDFCQEEACTSGVLVNCNDDNPCTQDGCDAEAGCVHTPTDGLCNDDNPCTLGEACSAGKCAPNGLLDCDDSTPCTYDWCDPNSGCQHTANEAACDDGSICTLGDKCKNGDCSGGIPLNCDDSNGCTNDTCNPLLGCKHTNNSEPCDDLDPCTASDQCIGGSCIGTGAIDCDDANSCTTDFCDPMAGCTHVPGQGSCDDGNPCSWGDQCLAGKCIGGKPVECDDANACTDDSCDPQSGCTHSANNAQCDDLNACTTDDHCANGQCVSEQPTECDDDNHCTTDICLPQGGCQYVHNSVPCNDGDACTNGDKCAIGQCVAGAPVQCNDGNPCTADSCLDGVCKFEPAAGDCDDGNPCTLNDQCGEGFCKPGVALDCNDDSICTGDHCDPQIGCVHTLNTAPCDDGDACSVGDVCGLGECKAGVQLNCDDGNPCTESACANGQCIHAPAGGECSDGNACTDGDHCLAGLCIPDSILACDDENLCTTDSCHPIDGCQHAAKEGSCDDGNACTTDDACAAGKCVGGPDLACNDSNVCTDDSCAPETGCLFQNNSAPCDDGTVCTETDTCAEGECIGSDAKDCADNDLCTTDSCHPIDGCLHVAIAPCCGNGQKEGGEECDDGNLANGDGCDSNCKSESINSAECQDYLVLSNYDRNITQNDGNGGVETCDGNMGNKWYRFQGAAGTKMPTSCPPKYSCGTDAPGWMNGSYPSVNDGIVNRKVCFNWDGNCCIWSTTIGVRNCKDYYVFKLPQTPNCTLRYCGTD